MRIFNNLKSHKKQFKFADKSIRFIFTGILIFSIFSLHILPQNTNYYSAEYETDNSSTQVDTNIQNVRSQLSLSETDAPVIVTYANDVSYSQGTGGNPILRWKISDANVDQYLIYRNGTITQNGTYLSNSFITVSLLNTPLGYHNYTIYANDTFGNFIVDEAWVNITDDTLPVFNLITQDFNITYGSNGNTVSWSVSDTNPKDYNVFRNGTTFHSGLWNNSGGITIEIDDLDFGMHNFTIFVYDISNNSISDSVVIHVKDNSSPVILSSPPNITFPFSTVGHNLVINATDSYPYQYTISQNGSQVSNGIWINNELIIWNLDYLEYGNYTFSIFLIDQYSNNITIYIDVFVVLLKGSTVPIFEISTDIFEGDIETIDSQWLDAYTDGIEGANITIILKSSGEELDTTYLEGISDNNGGFQLKLNYTGLSAGEYEWVIKFEAENFVPQEISFDFTIHRHNYDIIVPELADLTQGKPYHITANVYYANSISGLNLNVLTGKTGLASDVGVNLHMSMTLMEGSLWNISKNSISDGNGKIDFEMTILETSLLVSINSISLEIVGNEFRNSFEYEVSIDDFPLIITNDNSPHPSENSFADLLNQLETILAIVVIIFIVVLIIMVNKSRSKKVKTKIKDDLNIVLAELKALSSLQVVLLISRSGLPLYEKKLKTMGMDMVLLSGVTTAISALLQEAQDQQIFGLEIMESQGLSITSHKSKHSSLVFISTKSLPMIILNQMIEVHEKIELKYGDKLTYDSGNILDDDDLYEIFNENDIKLGLAGELELNLNELENSLAKVKKKNGEKVFFDTLVEINTKGISNLDANALLLLLREKGFTDNQAAGYIINAYNNEIIG